MTPWLLALTILHADGTISQPPAVQLDSEQECHAVEQADLAHFNHNDRQSEVLWIKCLPLPPLEEPVKPGKHKGLSH
jgi:hypothetical protein